MSARGRGMIHYGGKIFNKLLNSLPVELHLPGGYEFCGPGTKLSERLSKNQVGINPLDGHCRDHDIAYSQNRENLVARRQADAELAKSAWKRVKAEDSSVGEKVAALAVTAAMKIKRKLGMGCSQKKKKKTTNLSAITKAALKNLKVSAGSRTTIKSALEGARAAVKKAGGKSKIILPRVLSTKVGGAIPFLIPLFAGLSATGALSGGVASIVKAVNAAKSAQEELKESKRHNQTMESIALGKGLYLKPYRTGLGLYLKPYRTGLGLKKTLKKKTLKKKTLKKKKVFF